MTSDDVLTRIRDARFSGGVACPRCLRPGCPRWGRFSGRQRYRCHACRRTFSDLTGTPAAYTKRLALWWDYAFALEAAVSVRAAALRLGVHPTTTFRWRHRSLGGLMAADAERLSGWTEVTSAWFAHSEKGSRHMEREPRRRGLRQGWADTRAGVNVVIASDRVGHTVTCMTGPANGRRLYHHELECALMDRITGPPILSMPEGSFGSGSRFTRAIGGVYVDARPPRNGAQASPLVHMRTSSAYRARLQKWMCRFRGVATKYLPNYLAWHRVVDQSIRNGAAAQMLRWRLPSGFV